MKESQYSKAAICPLVQKAKQKEGGEKKNKRRVVVRWAVYRSTEGVAERSEADRGFLLLLIYDLRARARSEAEVSQSGRWRA